MDTKHFSMYKNVYMYIHKDNISGDLLMQGI